ncbi:hypothetical protein Trydic_g12692 [Trypoxylus dichotomus]
MKTMISEEHGSALWATAVNGHVRSRLMRTYLSGRQRQGCPSVHGGARRGRGRRRGPKKMGIYHRATPDHHISEALLRFIHARCS